MNFTDRLPSATPADTPLETPHLETLRQALLRRPRDAEGQLRPDLIKLLYALSSYERAYASEFKHEHDDFKLVGQDNIRRYLPVRLARIRIHPDDSAFEIFARVCAARVVGCRTTVSIPTGLSLPMVDLLDELTPAWGAMVEFVEESDAELADSIRRGETERVRYAAPDRVPLEVYQAVEDSGVYIARSPVLAEGRIELLWYLKEQSISYDYHRHGNLGDRAGERRRPVL